MVLNSCFDLVRNLSHQADEIDASEIPLFHRMKERIEKNDELLFILPAFPAKSPSPAKTSGKSPDMAEVIALQELNAMCAEISRLYPPGARLLICSDGRVFSDIVGVSDETIDHYSAMIDTIISEFNLTYLATFSMDDLYPELQGDELRQKLLKQYGRSPDEVRALVCSDENYRHLFNGIHRFLLEDMKDLQQNSSRTQLSKLAKEKAYELLRRSDAWSALLSSCFQEELRLSIHPYPLRHEKFGIKMVKSSSKWATPWHNVLVKVKDQFELMHLREALELNAAPKLYKEKYVYFEA